MPDISRRLVDETSELGLVGGVKEEKAETCVCMHNLDFGKELAVIRAIKRDGMEAHVPLNCVGFTRASEVDRLNVAIDTLNRCFMGDGNLQLSLA